jgi:L-alanine-DL-glutamate epimerase-like enolase superfamily enzyme
MRITKVSSGLFVRRYDGKIRNSRQKWNDKQHVLVFIDTDEGVSGVGEAWCPMASPKTLAAVLENDLMRFILGEDPLARERISRRIEEFAVVGTMGGVVYALASAIDMALWDLLGRFTGRPLYQLLGGHSNRVAVYGSGGMYGPDITPESLGREMAASVAGGTMGVKIKAAGGSLAEDVARIRSVREAIGPDAKLMIDALFVPTVPEAIRMAQAIEPFGIHFFEAPSALLDIAGWREVRDKTSIPLAGTEIQYGLDLHRDLVLSGAIHFIEFDLTLCGGITTGQKISAVAQAFHKPVSLHSAVSAVGLAASAHLGAAISNCDSIELHLLHQALFEHLWAAGYTVADGHMSVPETPGLGLDIEALRQAAPPIAA